MNLLSKIPVFLISTAIFVGIPHQLAVDSLESPEIGTIGKKITVFIGFPQRNSGSGVIIDKKGDTYSVLTAKHVVPTEDVYFVITPDKEKYKLDYSTVKKLPDLDLATLQFTSKKTYEVVQYGDSSQIDVGQKVYVAGFPHPAKPIPSSEYTFVPGFINTLLDKPLEDGGYKLVYDSNTRVGMSGGPVLNEDGKLVAIHGQAQKETITIALGNEIGELEEKTNFNLGIPLNSFFAANPSIPIPINRPTPTPPSRPSLPVAFTAPPRLTDAATTQDRTSVRGATYYFTISLPENAGAPLKEIQFQQTSGVDFLGYKISKTTGFEGTRKNRGAEVPLFLVEENRKTRRITVRLDKPLSPGKTVTIAMRPVKTPPISGVYQLRLTVFPPGESARPFPLSPARLHFYQHR